jgi:hypothetical protein
MPAHIDNLEKTFDAWTTNFTKQVEQNPGSKKSWCDLQRIGCDLSFIRNMLFQYCSIQAKERKRIRNEFKVMRRRVEALCQHLHKNAVEMRELCTQAVYGKRNMLQIHNRLRENLPEDLPRLEDLPEILSVYARHIVKLFVLYRETSFPFTTPDALLVVICEHIKPHAAGSPRYADIANVLWAAEAASGKDKLLGPGVLSKRIKRFKSKPHVRNTSWEQVLRNLEEAHRRPQET